MIRTDKGDFNHNWNQLRHIFFLTIDNQQLTSSKTILNYVIFHASWFSLIIGGSQRATSVAAFSFLPQNLGMVRTLKP